jgi:hypothetical protein
MLHGAGQAENGLWKLATQARNSDGRTSARKKTAISTGFGVGGAGLEPAATCV